MIEQKELLLRELLLSMSSEPTEEKLDELLPSLFQVRLDLDDLSLNEDLQSRHIEAIRHRALEGPNGRSSWLPHLLGLDRGHSERRLPLWPAFAALTVVGIVILVWLSLSRTQSNQPIAGVKGTPIPVVPHNQRAPVVRKDEPRAPESPVVPPKQAPGEHRNRPNHDQQAPRIYADQQERGLVARRVDVGKFAAIMGEPTVTVLGEKKGRNALPNMAVTDALRIETGDADKCVVRFNDGTTLALDFNTVLEIPIAPNSKFQAPDSWVGRPSGVVLKQGHVWAKVSHSIRAQHFAIATHVATAVDLGTEFGLELQHKDQVEMAVLRVRDGRVKFFNPVGEVVVPTGTESVATENAMPTNPRRLRVLAQISVGLNAVSLLSNRLTPAGALIKLSFPLAKAGFTIRMPDDGSHSVDSVDQATPAYRAGIRVGDHVVAIRGRKLNLTGSWPPEALMSEIDDEVECTIERGFQRRTFRFKGTPIFAPLPFANAKSGAAVSQATSPALAGNWPEAKRRLVALSRATSDPAVPNNLGVISELQDDLAGAIRWYEKAVRLNPNSARFHENLGQALGQIGNTRRAVVELSAAVRLDPNWEWGWGDLISSYLQSAEFSAASEALDKAQRRFPANSFLWLSRGTVLVYQRDTTRAEAAFRRGLALGSDKGKAHTGLYVMFSTANRLAEAEREARLAVAADPNAGTYHTNLGNVLRRMGRLSEAESEQRTAVALSPDVLPFHRNLGLVLKDEKKLDLAEAEYRTGIALEPTNAEIHNNLAGLLVMERRWSEVIPEYLKVIELSPVFSTDPYRNLGAIYFNVERKTAEAEALFRKGLEIDPDDSNLLTSLAACLEQDGKLDEAIGLLRKVRKLDPQNPYTMNNLAYDLAERGRDLDEALDLAVRATKAMPGEYSNVGTLGTVQAARHEFEDAERNLKKAIEMCKAGPLPLADCFADLASMYEKKGDVKAALEQYSKALKLNPQHRAALVAMKRLGG